MLLLLQLLENPLDIISDEVLLEKDFSFSGKEVISLDNYSEPWLVKAAIDSLQDIPEIVIGMLRNGNAEFKNLQPLINRLPQQGKVSIVFSGEVHPLIQRMENFRNITVLYADDKDHIRQQVKTLLTS